MKSNELRIGNWVGVLDKQSIIEIIHPQWVHLEGNFIHNGFDTITHISLNDEWLLRFGFGKFKSGQDSYFEHPDSGLRIYKSANGSRFLPAYFDKMISTIDLWNVSQLQNLFFALNGEELTLK